MVDIERLERIVRCPSVRRVTSGALLAEDAVQEARIAVWGVMEKRPDAPDSYLYAVATKAALSLLRGRKATGAPERSKMSGSPVFVDSLDELINDEESGGYEPPSTSWEPQETLRLAVEAVMSDLEPNDRELLRLRFWEGLTERDAAARLDRSRAWAYARWHKIAPLLAERLAA